MYMYKCVPMAELNFKCLFFLFVVPFLTTNALPIATSVVPFEDCGSIYYLESIEVSGCFSYPCQIRTASTVNVTTNFLVQGTEYDSEELVQNVYFVISSIQLEAQVSPDPCIGVQGSKACQLRNGERVKFQAAVRVDNVPPLPGTLWWTMTNSAHELLVCYKLTVVFTRA